MKLSKILSIVMVAVMLVTTLSNVAFAAIDPSQITPDTSDTNEIVTLGKKITGIIQTVGSIAAVAVLIVLGIKYMMGSAEEKAEYKKTMVPYVIGAVLVFAASNLASFIYAWANKI